MKELRADPSLFGVLAEHVTRMRNGREAVEALGLALHASCAYATRRSDPLYWQIIYHSDIYTKFDPTDPFTARSINDGKAPRPRMALDSGESETIFVDAMISHLAATSSEVQTRSTRVYTAPLTPGIVRGLGAVLHADGMGRACGWTMRIPHCICSSPILMMTYQQKLMLEGGFM